jgi:hypothetical protein
LSYAVNQNRRKFNTEKWKKDSKLHFHSTSPWWSEMRLTHRPRFRVKNFINIRSCWLRLRDTYKVTRSIVTLRFGSGSAVWQWNFLGFLGENTRCRHSTAFCNTQFYFPLSSMLSATVRLFADGRGSFPREVILLITVSVTVLGAVKFYLFFNSLHLLISFLPLFTFENKRIAVVFSTWKGENKHFPF